MVVTGFDISIEAAVRAIAYCSDDTVSSVCVTVAMPDAATAVSCERAAEAQASRFGVYVSTERTPDGLTLRFSAISSIRRERGRRTSSTARR